MISKKNEFDRVLTQLRNEVIQEIKKILTSEEKYIGRYQIWGEDSYDFVVSINQDEVTLYDGEKIELWNLNIQDLVGLLGEIETTTEG